jgi:hypothetical protein
MRAAFRVHAPIGEAQPFHRPPANQVLGDNLFRILRLHVAVPHGVWVNHHSGTVLALVKAAGLVDPHLSAESSLARELLQPRMQAAGSIGCARWPRRIHGPNVMADKDVTFKRGQAVILLGTDSRLTPRTGCRIPPRITAKVFLSS